MRYEVPVQELLSALISVLEEKHNIKLDDIPKNFLNSIIVELREFNISREFLEKYITQIVVPDLNRMYYENVRKYERVFGWGQIERQIHFLIGENLSKLGFSIHMKPIVHGTVVDIVLEQYGRYLPIILSVSRNDRIAHYKMCRLRSLGIRAYLIEIDRYMWRDNKLLSVVDINDLEEFFDKNARYRLNMKSNIYEETLYEIWKKYVSRGYLALRSHIENSVVYDLFLVGFSKIGVKKIRKSIVTMPTLLSKTLRKISRSFKDGVIDKIIFLTPATVFDKVISEVRKQIPTKFNTEVSIRPI